MTCQNWRFKKKTDFILTICFRNARWEAVQLPNEVSISVHFGQPAIRIWKCSNDNNSKQVSETFYSLSTALRSMLPYTSNNSRMRILLVSSPFYKWAKAQGGYPELLENELTWKRPAFELWLITVSSTNLFPSQGPLFHRINVRSLGIKICYICSAFMILWGHLERTGERNCWKGTCILLKTYFNYGTVSPRTGLGWNDTRE